MARLTTRELQDLLLLTSAKATRGTVRVTPTVSRQLQAHRKYWSTVIRKGRLTGVTVDPDFADQVRALKIEVQDKPVDLINTAFSRKVLESSSRLRAYAAALPGDPTILPPRPKWPLPGKKSLVIRTRPTAKPRRSD